MSDRRRDFFVATLNREKKEVEQTNNGWISVKDRLPELYKDVWIYVPKYGVRQGYRIEQVIYADNLEYVRKIYWKEFGLEIYQNMYFPMLVLLGRHQVCTTEILCQLPLGRSLHMQHARCTSGGTSRGRLF